MPDSADRIEKVAVREHYKVEMDDDMFESQGFGADPASAARRFLEERGFEVNDVRIEAADGVTAEMRPTCNDWYHEVWPHRSTWSIVC